MEDEINRFHQEKIINPFIPSLVKFQRAIRRNKEKQNLHQAVHKLVVMSKMLRSFKSYGDRCSFHFLKYKIERLGCRDYQMKTRNIKKQQKIERMNQRDQERKNVKVFRLNVVAGILNKFYSSWHLKKSRESLLFETQN